MGFKNIKDKILRKIHRFQIGSLGAAVCSAQLLLELYSFAINLFINNSIRDITSIIFLVINCVFDLYLIKYFITSKENNSLAPARIGIIFLIIANYVLPAIRTGISSLFTNSIGVALFSLLISGVVLGIIYFILLILEYKKIGKYNYLIMAIVGGIMVLISLVQGALTITNGVLILLSSYDVLYNTLIFIYLLLSAFVSIGMSVIFFLYPLFAIREARRGY